MSEKFAFFNETPISPLRELAAYEAIWENQKTSFKGISDMFAMFPAKQLSDFANAARITEVMSQLNEVISKSKAGYDFNLLISKTLDFPKGLLDATDKLQLLYYAGNLELLKTRSVAVVGTRHPSNEGVNRAERIVKYLVKDGFTIASGLANGIDTIAHNTALKNGGSTFAVIGTPINEFYPKDNKELQKEIALKQLLISQVPILRYSYQSPKGNRLFFPERNKTMSALTEATIIIEAGETSGTLVQAKAALQQGRKLFILNSCFENKAITWPQRFEKQGAIRVREYNDILDNLPGHEVTTD